MSAPTTEQLEEMLKFAVEIAVHASDVVRAGQRKRFENFTAAATKANRLDILTETDVAVEKLVKTAIETKYPDHKFIGEEGVSATGGKVVLGEGFHWIVDPIDGTNNFVHGFPFVGCSIGLTCNSEPIVGVIAMAFENQIFYARRGGGAFVMTPFSPGPMQLPITGKPQPLQDLSSSSVGFEFASKRSGPVMEAKYKNFQKMLRTKEDGGKHIHAARIVGSSTGNLTLVAAGAMDVFSDGHCSHPWDVCAAMVIITEGGGYVCGGSESFKRAQAGDVDSLGKIMMSRCYTFIRAVAPTETETSEQIQKRIAAEVYETIEGW